MNVALQNAPEIVVIGDVLIDLVVDVPEPARAGSKVLGRATSRDIGGVGFNVAIALARLERPVRLLARVGDDADGDRARALLRSEGVDLDGLITELDRATGTCLIQRGADGERAVTITDGALLFPAIEQLQAESMAGARWVHLAPFDPVAAIAAASMGQDLGCRVSIDLEPTSLPDLEQLSRLLCHVDVCILNEHAAAALPFGTASSLAQGLRDLGPATIIETMGAAGVYVSDAARSWQRAAPRIDVVDTTGAGDVFAAALIERLVHDPDDLDGAVDRALRAAAFACARPGSWQAAPRRTDLDG
jgi:ribokinase